MPADPEPAVAELETIVSLSKRRGFIFPSSEIYGGINAVWDYGPLGVELKNNVKRAWWRAMVQERDDIVALDSAILQHPRVWEASGHLAGFTDPLVQCLGKCKRRWREDHLREAVEAEGGDPSAELRCPECSTWMQACHTPAEMELLDRRQSAAREAIVTAYESSVKESMSALAADLHEALARDLIGADDFRPRAV